MIIYSLKEHEEVMMIHDEGPSYLLSDIITGLRAITLNNYVFIIFFSFKLGQ